MKCHLECLPGPTEKLCTKQKHKLGKFIEKRVAWEFQRAHQMYGRNINQRTVYSSWIMSTVASIMS